MIVDEHVDVRPKPALQDCPVDLELKDLVHVVADLEQQLVGVLAVVGSRAGLIGSAVELHRRSHHLEGAPGVRSARYAGETATDEDNVSKLLLAMKDVAAESRTARFRCVLAYVREAGDPDPLFADGAWEGSIAFEPSGEKGFGYDPVFLDAASGKSAAELEASAKNARSHRGKALQALRELLGSRGL